MCSSVSHITNSIIKRYKHGGPITAFSGICRRETNLCFVVVCCCSSFLFNYPTSLGQVRSQGSIFEKLNVFIWLWNWFLLIIIIIIHIVIFVYSIIVITTVLVFRPSYQYPPNASLLWRRPPKKWLHQSLARAFLDGDPLLIRRFCFSKELKTKGYYIITFITYCFDVTKDKDPFESHVFVFQCSKRG